MTELRYHVDLKRLPWYLYACSFLLLATETVQAHELLLSGCVHVQSWLPLELKRDAEGERWERERRKGEKQSRERTTLSGTVTPVVESWTPLARPSYRTNPMWEERGDCELSSLH